MHLVGLSMANEATPLPFRSKRKGEDDIANHLSEFSLSSPAFKIRRLDECKTHEASPMIFEDTGIIHEKFDGTAMSEHSIMPNHEMAIVLYDPVMNPGGVSLTVDPNFMAHIKKLHRSFLPNCSPRTANSREGGEASGDGDQTATKNTHPVGIPCLPQVSDADSATGTMCLCIEDEMDYGEGAEAMLMDVEEEVGQGMTDATSTTTPAASVGMGPFGGLQQWQQQHCLYPDAPPNATAAIQWFW